MNTSIASVVSLKNSIISLGQTVILIIGNCLIRITSRRRIAKLLLRLPENFFPRYRLVVSPAVIENNLEMRKSLGSGVKRGYYSESSSDDSEENFCTCCTHCQKNLETTFIMNITTMAESSTPNKPPPSISPPPPAPMVVPPPPKLPELNPIDFSPPLRRITAQELRSVKLRPSVVPGDGPKTPEVDDMLRILRKRYAVMRFSFSGEQESGSEMSQVVSFG